MTDNGGLSATTILTVFVINVDEPPYFMESSPILRTIREMPAVVNGDAALALIEGVLAPTSIDVKDPEPGAVNISIVDGRQRASFSLSTPVYVAGIRTTQVMLTVANASVLDYETLHPDYAVRLVLTSVDLGGHYVNSSLVWAAYGVINRQLLDVDIDHVHTTLPRCACHPVLRGPLCRCSPSST